MASLREHLPRGRGGFSADLPWYLAPGLRDLGVSDGPLHHLKAASHPTPK